MEYFNYLNSVESHEAPDYDRLIELYENQLTDEELKNPDLGVLDSDNEPNKIDLESELKGKVIDGRFKINEYSRSEFAVFVHNGLDSMEFCRVLSSEDLNIVQAKLNVLWFL